MKSLLNFAGWLLLLVVLGFGLVLYNAVHMPALRRLARQSDEIGMWTSEIELLRDSLDRATLLPETTFTAVFSFDELFGGAEGFAISKDGESSLRDIVTMLQQSSGAIAVTDDLKNWELL